jgi:hypothetical protein
MKGELMKKGQMKLSFGMIVSIILIIIFISFAFYAIKIFLGIKDAAQIGAFGTDLQNDVDKIWKGSQGSQDVKYNLPNKVKNICFDDKNPNLIINFKVGFEEKQIEHLNIVPFCVDNIGGKVSIVLKKNFGEEKVTITTG